MPDIVEVLEGFADTEMPIEQLAVLLEAAAEIKRLRKDLEIWKRNGGDILQRAEIERLQRHIYTLEGLLGEMNIAVPECAALDPKP